MFIRRLVSRLFVYMNMKFILGKKIKMTQMFDEKKNVIPVTLIEAGPCFVLQAKTKEKDKYEAFQIGFEKLEDKKVKKPQKSKPYKHVKEFSARGGSVLDGKTIGDKIDVSIFEKGDKVKISGISKGKGYAGAVKRWGFHGRNATHGTKHEERTIGSTGSRFPQRVIKGRKMPGRMGSERISVKNLKIEKIDLKNNIMAVRGAVPGRKGTLLEITA
jgi:large subunit ribosomal protein L3